MRMPADKRHHTISEYLRLERASEIRHEYRDGEMVAMAGGSVRHSRIIANLIRVLGNALRGSPCGAFDGNLRVRVPRTPLFVYPDASVICGEPQTDPADERGETVTNPRLIAEVLSPTTENYDRGKKFTHYREIESLQEFILVSQDAPEIELFVRGPTGDWIIKPHAVGLEAHLKLESLNISLLLSEIYDGVKFDTKPADAGDQPADGAI